MPGTVASPYTIVYSFGDSLSDSGLASLVTKSPIATGLGYSPEPVSPPYHQTTYPGGVTASEFSDGPVWVQDLAGSLGLADPAPATLSATPNQLSALGVSDTDIATLEIALGALAGPNQQLTLVSGAAGGTDYAIGGSVTGVTAENTGVGVQVSDLAAQVVYFHNTSPAPAASALFTVWSGSNDILNLLEDPKFGTYGAAVLAGDVAASVAAETAAVSSLVADGARNLLVLTVPNLGEVPAIDQSAAYMGEIAQATSLSASFNAQLLSSVGALASGGVHVTFEDTYSLLDLAIASPAAYGFADVKDPAYTGSFTSDDGTVVANPDSYLFFDMEHPTRTGHGYIAQQALAALALACFAEGTRIAAPSGLVPVETIRAGDTVLAASGGRRRVVWVGARRVDCARHPDPRAVQPVRVRAGAFGPGAPGRDLLLSPDHALFLHGVLIPVRHLVDGSMVAQLPAASVTYWHVELESHDALLAEGLPCESFLDTGQRGAFAGSSAPQLHPDFAARVWEAEGFAPLRVAGPEVDRARETLRRRRSRAA